MSRRLRSLSPSLPPNFWPNRMHLPTSPAELIQRQLEAYNARNMDAWLATYAPQARQYLYPATLVAEGHEQIRARMRARFAEPNLHARLLQRHVMGKMVIDVEIITRTFPEGPGRLQMAAIYEVEDGLIQSAVFIAGEPQLAIT